MMQVERPSEGQYMMQVKWYFAPDGAQTYYGLDSFSSGIWDRDTPALPPDLGERPPYDRPFYNGKNVWGYVGQCIIGTPEQYAEGLSAADLAAPPPVFGLIPSCCKPASVLGPLFGISFDWSDPSIAYPVDPGFLGFRFDFLDPVPPGPGVRVNTGFAFDWQNPTPPGAGPMVPIGFRLNWLDPSQPPPPQNVLWGFRFDWLRPTPPGPPPSVDLGLRFDWLRPIPPGPGQRVNVCFAFDWRDPSLRPIADQVNAGFRFDWIDPTPPAPGVRVNAGFRFDWLDPTLTPLRDQIIAGFRFDWLDPTPPAPGVRVNAGFRFDWLDPSSGGGGILVEVGWRLSWFADVSSGNVVTPCNPAGTAPTMHVALSPVGVPTPFDGSYLVTFNALTSRWENVTAGYTVYVACNTIIGPHTWIVGVIQGGVDQFGGLTGTVGPPFGITMWVGFWPAGNFGVIANVAP